MDTESGEIEGTDEVRETLAIRDVADILQPQFIIISGGKTKEGCSVITFPDQLNFHLLSNEEYERLILYLTADASSQEEDLGFHIIVDRRKDRWNSVKAVLLKISRYFPGLVHVVYVIRPESIFQKALSELSHMLSSEKFKFRLVILNGVEELQDYIEPTQLTMDLGGNLQYVHHEWIQQKIALEQFSQMTKEVSDLLNHFTQQLSQSEFPNNVDGIQLMLEQRENTFSELKDKILKAAKNGEVLLQSIKDSSQLSNSENALTVARLLIQLQETECTFDSFWHQYSIKLRQCLELRQFEQEFRELQSNFDSHLKTVTEMTEVGETVNRVDTLIQETNAFKKLCDVDNERSEEVISLGRLLLNNQHIYPTDCIEPKCDELLRVSSLLTDRVSKRICFLFKCRELMERIEKANIWCTKGVDLLASQQIEKCSQSPELAGQSLQEIQHFVASASEFKLNSPREFRSIFEDSITPETKALVSQVLQRIDDISLMCDKRVSNLKKLAVKPLRPIQHVTPKPALPLQPSGGAPYLNKGPFKIIYSIKNETGTECATSDLNLSRSNSTQFSENEQTQVKQLQVLTELIETERVYVAELNSILLGYKKEFESEDNASCLPEGFTGKINILFGNLEDIYQFHSVTFLKDLENCIISSDLVALCFIQKREEFYRLYSYYCQNIEKSERVRESLMDNESQMFLYKCQSKLGHKLPLAAYLLKPVQRITKYQLLLKDLLRYNSESSESTVQKALDCMLVVLKLVNDSMHQYAITGFPMDLSQQGELLLHGSFSVWARAENRKDLRDLRDLRLRLKPMQRHLFLFQKIILFCKQTSVNAAMMVGGTAGGAATTAATAAPPTYSQKTHYHYKHYLKMSQIGLTESVKGDTRKFELWLQGRQEVYTVQAATAEQKQTWVNEIKKVLFNQLEELRGEKIKQYYTQTYKQLRQTNSLEKQPNSNPNLISLNRAVSVGADNADCSHIIADEECLANLSVNVGVETSDCSNSEDDDQDLPVPMKVNSQYVALADYCAVGNSEVSFQEGNVLELCKVGCGGWWYVKLVGRNENYPDRGQTTDKRFIDF